MRDFGPDSRRDAGASPQRAVTEEQRRSRAKRSTAPAPSFYESNLYAQREYLQSYAAAGICEVASIHSATQTAKTWLRLLCRASP